MLTCIRCDLARNMPAVQHGTSHQASGSTLLRPQEALKKAQSAEERADDKFKKASANWAKVGVPGCAAAGRRRGLLGNSRACTRGFCTATAQQLLHWWAACRHASCRKPRRPSTS